METYFQTGDVLYKQREKIPDGFKPIKGNLIHQGRDHHHRIEGDFQLHGGDGDSLYIEAKKNCKLTHPEHKTITLPVGIWEKGVVMEFDHLLEESRRVID